jgi:hypothetical protein
MIVHDGSLSSLANWQYSGHGKRDLTVSYEPYMLRTATTSMVPRKRNGPKGSCVRREA